MRPASNRGLSDHSFVVLITVVAALAAILIFVTGRENIPQFFNPTPSSQSSTAIPTTSPIQAPLFTPTPCVSGAYTVQAGETLPGIAVKFGLSIEQLLAVNPTMNVNSQVVEYQKINIPCSLQPVSISEQCVSGIHTIQAGDTLWGITIQYRITFDDLFAVNPDLVENSLLRIGQRINIPCAPE
jgi:LysM repeat protein